MYRNFDTKKDKAVEDDAAEDQEEGEQEADAVKDTMKKFTGDDAGEEEEGDEEEEEEEEEATWKNPAAAKWASSFAITADRDETSIYLSNYLHKT